MVNRKRVKAKVRREVTEEIDLLGTVLSGLVELIEEKGILTQEECEKRVKSKVNV